VAYVEQQREKEDRGQNDEEGEREEKVVRAQLPAFAHALVFGGSRVALILCQGNQLRSLVSFAPPIDPRLRLMQQGVEGCCSIELARRLRYITDVPLARISASVGESASGLSDPLEATGIFRP
jgi:hypothetical protein